MLVFYNDRSAGAARRPAPMNGIDHADTRVAARPRRSPLDRDRHEPARPGPGHRVAATAGDPHDPRGGSAVRRRPAGRQPRAGTGRRQAACRHPGVARRAGSPTGRHAAPAGPQGVRRPRRRRRRRRRTPRAGLPRRGSHRHGLAADRFVRPQSERHPDQSSARGHRAGRAVARGGARGRPGGVRGATDAVRPGWRRNTPGDNRCARPVATRVLPGLRILAGVRRRSGPVPAAPLLVLRGWLAAA